MALYADVPAEPGYRNSTSLKEVVRFNAIPSSLPLWAIPLCHWITIFPGYFQEQYTSFPSPWGGWRPHSPGRCPGLSRLSPSGWANAGSRSIPLPFRPGSLNYRDGR